MVPDFPSTGQWIVKIPEKVWERENADSPPADLFIFLIKMSQGKTVGDFNAKFKIRRYRFEIFLNGKGRWQGNFFRAEQRPEPLIIFPPCYTVVNIPADN